MAKLNSAPEQGQNIDLLRRKFGAQNRAIAKSYAGLQDKILQLEQKISDLLKENLDLKYDNLRLTKSLAENTTRRSNEMLQNQFVQVKNLLDIKFKEMQDIIALGFNLDAEDSFKDDDNEMKSIINRKRSSQLRLSNCIDEVTETNDTQANDTEIDHIETIEINETNDNQQTQRTDSIESHTIHSDIPIENHSPLPAEKAKPPSSKSSPSKSLSPVKNSQSIFTVIKSPTTESLANKSPTNKSPTVKSPTNKVTKKPTVKKFKRKPLTAKSPNKKIENASSPLPISKSTSRRTTRVKDVNYALPSLRTKMRRPTEKLVDAVQADKENN